MHSPIALLDLTQRTSQQPFSVSLCTPKYPSFTSPMHSQNTLSLWHSPTALLYLLLSCTPLYLSMSHSALPGSSPLFLTVHFPTALPNAVWSPLCNIMCVGEWFGENVLSVKQPHSPHRLQKKRERERERKKGIYLLRSSAVAGQPLHSTSKTGVCQSPTMPHCSPRRRGRHNPLDTGTVLQMAVYDWSSPVG